MSRNPILTQKAFDGVAGEQSPAEEWQQAQQMGAASTATAAGVDAVMAGRPPVPAATDGKVMSLGGVAAATAIMFAVLLATATWGWSLISVSSSVDPATGAETFAVQGSPWGYVMVAAIVALVAALVTAFKPKLARFTGLVYAAAEDVVLGVISHLYDLQFNGIVVQAVLGTLGVFVVMLVLFGLRVLRATPRFTKGVVAATFGVFFIYLIGFVASLFGVDLGFWGTSGSPLGIIISVVVCIVAALNLILDFEFIEQGTKQGLPAYMDWYAGFGLMVTLVWL
ncbi:MAG: Bax inhibitor-1/YccA family protein, partial [Actinomycetes bacterium]